MGAFFCAINSETNREYSLWKRNLEAAILNFYKNETLFSIILQTKDTSSDQFLYKNKPKSAFQPQNFAASLHC